MNNQPTAKSARGAALLFILVTVALDILAMGMIIPVLPKLVTGFVSGNNVEAHAARIYGLFATVWALAQFFCAPLLGAISDRFGRRKVILLSNFGLGLDYIVMALAPNLAWLFVGRVVSGITASSIPTAYAYITDVTPPEKRAAAFGKIGASFGLGFVVGPAVGGFLGEYNPHAPFWAAAVLSLLNGCYGFFVLPESLPPEKRSSFKWSRANPVGALQLLRSHPELLGLSAVLFLSFLPHEVLPSTFVLFADHKFGWGARAIGATLATVGICTGIVQGTLVHSIVTRFGERRTILAGTLAGITAFTVYGLAPNPWLFWAGTPIISLWGISTNAAQSLMSRRVDPSDQGKLQGANASLRAITSLLGPGLFTTTYAAFIAKGRTTELPGAPFLLAASILVAAWVVAWFVARSSSDRQRVQTAAGGISA